MDEKYYLSDEMLERFQAWMPTRRLIKARCPMNMRRTASHPDTDARHHDGHVKMSKTIYGRSRNKGKGVDGIHRTIRVHTLVGAGFPTRLLLRR